MTPRLSMVRWPAASLITTLVFAFVAVASTAQPGSGSPVASVDLPASVIRPRSGAAYSARLPIDSAGADAVSHPRRSTWILLEDDLPLGPAHALHADIESKGRGRYSHWNDSIIFSTSDNSDPRTNGRTYALVRGVDEAGRRLHFDSPGSIMVLRRGERLWWPGGGGFEPFVPRFGPRRPEVNPALPCLDGPTLRFDVPGEYGLRSGGRALRLLVLDDDPAHHARQIVSFIAANTTGGRADEPAGIDGVIDWPAISRTQFHHLFSTEDSLDVACGESSRLVVVLAQSVGLQARYCGWIGGDEAYAGHIGVEIFNARNGSWEYFDPHFGLSACDRLDAATLALSLQGAFAGREDRAFTVLVEKIAPQDAAVQFRSFKEALQLWHDRSHATSAVLLLRDVVPATVDPDRYEETEFFSASRDLARFRASFYAPALAGVEREESARE